MNYTQLAKTNLGLLEIAKAHIEQAKQTAMRLQDTDNPNGVTLVIHETTLMMLFSSAVGAGIETQRDWQDKKKAEA